MSGVAHKSSEKPKKVPKRSGKPESSPRQAALEKKVRTATLLAIAKTKRAQRAARHNVWKELQLPAGGASLITVMTEGFAYRVIDRLAQFSGMEKGRVAQLTNISPSTMSRRAAQGKFNADESDRLWRMARLLELATELFEGDEQAAREWIDRPAHGLGNRSPLEMIGSSLEFETVTTLIERLEHGVMA